MQINTSQEIGILVRQRRKEVALSQQALAGLIGASRQWIQNLETGKPGLELGLTIRALTALGIRLDARPVAIPVGMDQKGKRALTESQRRQSRGAPIPTGGLGWQSPWERAEMAQKRQAQLPSVDIDEIVAPVSRKRQTKRK